MPYAGTDFSPIGIGSQQLLSFDYVNLLATGETVDGATWTSLVVAGTDAASPNDIINGSASIAGSIVTQMIDLTDTTNVVDANVYLLTCAAVTSLGQTILVWAHLTTVTPA